MVATVIKFVRCLRLLARLDTVLKKGRDIALRCPRARQSGRNESGKVCALGYSVPSPDAALGDGERRSAPSLP